MSATGTASMPSDTPKILLGDFQSVAVVGKTEPASEMSYATGKWLAIPPFTLGIQGSTEYLRDVRETDALYANEKIVHTGMLLRTMNWALMENAILGPWIHVGSTIRYLAAAGVEDESTSSEEGAPSGILESRSFDASSMMPMPRSVPAIVNCPPVNSMSASDASRM